MVSPPRSYCWTRSEIADWLIEKLNGPQRFLIGLDFGFGLPYEEGYGYLGGKASGIDNIFDLWSQIEEKSCNETDFGCTSFIGDAEHSSLFWFSGRRPPHWIERKRRTEGACAELTGTYPDTLYKLVGPKQVGKASLTGMRVLHRVRSRVGENAAIWPFDKRISQSAIVEIYPTLFRRHATGDVAKIRSGGILNNALSHLDSSPIPGLDTTISDNDTDALLSAAGLRFLVRTTDVWSLPELELPQVRHEGWIFGV
jgi:hypothetical protein